MAVLKSAKQEKFVQNLIAGMSQRQAYLDAYPNSNQCKDETIDNKASRLFRNSEIWARYQEVQEQQKEAALLTRWEKWKILADIARNSKNDTPDRIRAIDTDNKMEGEYISKVEISKQPEDDSLTGIKSNRNFAILRKISFLSV
ncbi:MAG: terminase small subunit [Lachnospiraceae bacterium]|nr:terminase small subunit [Lachnospiraceae bacterium]